jgi:hypothetical protein
MRLFFFALIRFAGASSSSDAQGSPLIGTWKINLEKSRAVLGGPSTPQVNTIEFAAPNGIRYVTVRTDTQGRTRRSEFTAQFDGKTVSQDGLTWTWVSTGLDDQNQVFSRVAILEKQRLQ